jgi:CheY-like chemotaxis protein
LDRPRFCQFVPRLFGRFVQERQALDRSRRGLGLAIVKDIVALHGGSVSARSDGVGTAAYSRCACRSPKPGASPADGAAAPAPGGSACSVLLADDNPDVLAVMRSLLELGCHAVTAVPDPQAALALPDGFAPLVALVDIALPSMSGYELADALRRRPDFRDTDFVVVSGYGQPEDRARSEAAGFRPSGQAAGGARAGRAAGQAGARAAGAGGAGSGLEARRAGRKKVGLAADNP